MTPNAWRDGPDTQIKYNHDTELTGFRAPKALADGQKIGVKISTAGGSMKVPTTSRITFIISRSTYVFVVAMSHGIGTIASGESCIGYQQFVDMMDGNPTS